MTDTWDTFEQATQVAEILKHRFSYTEWAEQISGSDGQVIRRAISKPCRLLARHLEEVKNCIRKANRFE